MAELKPFVAISVTSIDKLRPHFNNTQIGSLSKTQSQSLLNPTKQVIMNI